MTYYSQIQQDKFVNEYFNKDNGVFIDIGAHNGIDLSNTLFFEKERGWGGICIEPCPNNFQNLIINRTCKCLECAISDYNGDGEFTFITGYSNTLSGLTSDYHPRHLHRIKREMRDYGCTKETIIVPVRTLQSVLDEFNITEVDYCSIDTEGNELKIVKSIDFDKVKIHLFTIENNYGDNGVREFMESKGYNMLTNRHDEIFVK